MSKKYENNVDAAIDVINSELLPEQVESLLALSSNERETFFRELARTHEERLKLWTKIENWKRD